MMTSHINGGHGCKMEVKMRVKIRLETIRDANDFANITSKVGERVVISDGNGLCVNAKSVLGALHALEFNDLWCESEKNIFAEIRRFIVE